MEMNPEQGHTMRPEQEHKETHKTYLHLMNRIGILENRLWTQERINIFFDIIIILASIWLIDRALENHEHVSYLMPFFILLILIIGMAITTHWLITSMKAQLKLKLLYFQARGIERKLNRDGENFITDEHSFYNPEQYRLESFDKKEVVSYPVEGAVSLDGFLGSVRPRALSIYTSAFFFFVIWALFLITLFRFYFFAASV